MNEPIGEHARKLERDAIVAMMRRKEAAALELLESSGGDRFDCGAYEALRGLADEIERGDHFKGGE